MSDHLRRLLVFALCLAPAAGWTAAPPRTAPSEQEPSAPPSPPESTKPGDLPPGHPQVGSKPTPAFELPAVQPGSGTGATGMRWTAPNGWISEPPANPMRRAQYRVPGPGGEGACVVFYFGPGQGGDPKANVERWASQFTTADGRPGTAVMKTREWVSHGVPILSVETRGTYLGGAGAMGAGSRSQTGYALLGAVATGADANWFFKLVGPEATIEAARDDFETMLQSVEKGG